MLTYDDNQKATKVHCRSAFSAQPQRFFLTHPKLKYRVDGLQKNGFSSQEYLLAVKIVKTTHSGDSTRRVFFKLKILQVIFVCCT